MPAFGKRSGDRSQFLERNRLPFCNALKGSLSKIGDRRSRIRMPEFDRGAERSDARFARLLACDRIAVHVRPEPLAEALLRVPLNAFDDAALKP